MHAGRDDRFMASSLGVHVIDHSPLSFLRETRGDHLMWGTNPACIRGAPSISCMSKKPPLANWLARITRAQRQLFYRLLGRLLIRASQWPSEFDQKLTVPTMSCPHSSSIPPTQQHHDPPLLLPPVLLLDAHDLTSLSVHQTAGLQKQRSSGLRTYK